MRKIVLYLMVTLAVTACNGVPVGLSSEPEVNKPVETSLPLPPIEDADSEPTERPTDPVIAPEENEIPTAPLVVPENIKEPEKRGAVYIDFLEVVQIENIPFRMGLWIKGSLPTPCHHLRYDIAQPDVENRIEVEMYSVSDPEMICVQVLAPFEEIIPLDNLPAGTFTVFVNGNLAGELQLPE